MLVFFGNDYDYDSDHDVDTERMNEQLVKQIHRQTEKIVMVTTGGGSAAANALLTVPGASRVMLELLVPYSRTSFVDFVGREPERYVSEQTAHWLAGRAFARALQLERREAVCGVACTATLVTDRPKKGDHHAWVCIWSSDTITTAHLTLEKGARDRVEEEAAVSQLILKLIAALPSLWQGLRAGDALTVNTINLRKPVEELVARAIDWVGVYDVGRVKTAGISPELLLSGSFNPLHRGHISLAEAAMTHTGKPVAFELPVINAEKPTIEIDETLRRLGQFAGRYPVYLSNAPTFIEKARLYGATTFVVGYDTAERIINPHFYPDNDVDTVLVALREAGCHFLVGGRVDDDGEFQSAGQLPVPAGYDDLFTPLPNFRVDISSSEIRGEESG